MEESACKCGAKVQRRQLDEHKASLCPQRPFSCEYCGYSATFQEVTVQHWKLCEAFPVDCPHHCMVGKIARAELQSHLNNACPHQEVVCEFSHAGCSVQVPRQALAQHLAKNFQHHMAIMSSSLMAEVAGLKDSLLKKSTEDERKTQELEVQLELRKENDSLRDKIKCMQLELEHKATEHRQEMEMSFKALDREKEEVKRLQFQLDQFTLQSQEKEHPSDESGKAA